MKKDKAQKNAELKAAILQRVKSLIVPVIFLVLIGVGVYVLLTYKEAEEEGQIIVPHAYEGPTSIMVMDNGKLKFELDPTTTQFSVTVKDTGAVWYSNPKKADSDTFAQNIEKDKLLSTLSLTYSTKNGVDTVYNNYTYSIKNQIYDIEQGSDDRGEYIKVLYSIGEKEKEYVIPPVISAERFEAYLALMDVEQRTRTDSYYKKYDLNNLGKKDDPEELKASYPIINDGPIYVVRSNAKGGIRTKMAEYFEEVGYTLEDWEADKANDLTNKTSDKPVFNVNVYYRLDGDNFLVEVPFEEIEYMKKYPVYSLTVLPNFGAGGLEDTGYMMVPEGGGALIDFNNGKTAQNNYYANLYGWDMGLERSAVVHETRTAFNAFGIANNGTSCLCVIESGASYGSIEAQVSGRANSFNTVCANYSLLHRAQFEIGVRTTVATFIYEQQLPAETIVQRYRFIGSDDYVDMAESYRDYMIGKYGSALAMNSDTSTPVNIEIIGAVDKVEQVVGIPVSRPVKLTSFKEAEELLAELQGDGIKNLSVKYSGWCNGGVMQKVLNSVKPISKLGGSKGLNNLSAYAAQNGIDLYLNGVTDFAYDSDWTDGFLVFRDASRFVSKEKAELHKYSTVTYAEREGTDPYYLLKNSEINEMADNLQAATDKYNAGVSFEDIGKVLTADYYRKAPVSREAAMLQESARLKALSESGKNVMINMGNDYAIAYADMVTNMDLLGAGYTIIDHNIPFYQIALHGYINYTGESLNLAQNKEELLLKSAEYGAGLSFALMKESAFALQKTLYTEYFGAEYASWHGRILDIYNRYNSELGHTFNQKIKDHQILGKELACTVYEDGTKVIVNYGYEDAIAYGKTIPARDYVVVK